MAAAAALGGVAGLVLLGPLTAVAAAGAAAYATTRSDEVGDAARTASKVAIDGVAAAKSFDSEHNISGRAVSAAKAAAAKAKELDEKHNLVGRAKAAGAAAVQSAKELEAKHQASCSAGSLARAALTARCRPQVTKKVGNALGSGLDRLSKMLEPKQTSTPAAPLPSPPS
jgi:hypothetical protein